MVDQLRFFAGAARVLEGRAAGEYLAGHTSWIRREPIGVVGQVTPWNYPLMMAVWKIAPALAAGNTVVLKPSDTTPQTTLLLAEIAAEFLPAGRAQRRHRRPRDRPPPGRAPDPGHGLDHRLGAGRARRSRRAPRRTLKRVHLELGGKAPVVVFDDADIAAAVEGIAHRRLLQRRPGLHRRHPGARARAASTTTSSRRSPSTPRTRAGRRARTTRTRCSARSTTPTSSPGSPASSTGCPSHATVVGRRQPPRRPRRRLLLRADRRLRAAAGRRGDPERDLRPGHHRAAFTDEDEALALGQRRATTGSRPSCGPRTSAGRCGCRRALDFGCVWINTHIPLVAEMPHGGFKHSGYGKDLSMYGFEDYTRIKHVMANIEMLTADQSDHTRAHSGLDRTTSTDDTAPTPFAADRCLPRRAALVGAAVRRPEPPRAAGHGRWRRSPGSPSPGAPRPRRPSGGRRRAAGAAPTDVSDTEKIVNWANWTAVPRRERQRRRASPTLEAFTKQTGIKVSYSEDVDDNDSYYAKVGPQLEPARTSTATSSR